MSSLDYLDLCRLCLVKDRVSVPIFEGEGDVRQIFLKIAACLPVKLTREDKLPKKICDDCVYKVELFYQFWNTTANAEKQLLQWLGEVSLEDKQGYVTNVLNPSVMKQEQSTENRLDGNVMQQVEEHQNNMGMGMMDNMGLGIPMIISSANQQQITSVPMDTSSNSVQTIQAVPGPSSQTTHNQIPQNQTSSTQQEDEEESSEDEENSDEECDGDEGLPVKEESEEDPSNRTIEPTTFVNVSLACDEAGPSGLQQQKISDMPEMPIPQPTDGDPKSGDLGNVDWDVKSEASSERTIEVLESELEPLPSPPDPHAYCELSCEDPPPPRPSIDTTTTAPPTNACRPVDTGDVHGRNTGMRKIGTRWRGFEDDEECRKRYTCSVCELEFAKHRDYKRHMVKHSDARPYICSTCGKAFKRSSEICNHRRIHRDIKYTCEICGFTTNNKISLRMHHRRVHERDYRYRCDQCDKGFMSNYDLEDHKTSHLETKAFICEFCGNGYSQRSYLVSHKRVMHGIKMSTPKAFQCNICNKRSFATEQELRSHLNLHSQMFLCAECGQKFATNYALKLHCRRHTGEKPYQCPFCPKAFARSPALRVHKLTHTGERPYVCNICGQSFTQRSSLMVHHKKHPGNHPPPPPLPLTRLAKEKS